MKKILIIAGEPSADLHGANLVKAVRNQVVRSGGSTGDIEFIGIGGRLMKEAGVNVIYDSDRIAVVGISEVIRHLGMIREAFSTVEAAARDRHVDLAVLIDFPDFNLRLAKKLHAMGVPLLYYISPQVWAWRKGRINKIARYFRKVLVIFGFEEAFYKQAGVDVEFVGHPLVSTVRMTKTRQELLDAYGMPAGTRVIALLPGSRTSEVRRHLPIMLEAASLLLGSYKNLSFIVPVLSSQAGLCRQMVEDSGLPVKIIIDDTYNAVGMSEFAVVTSGTATLETALLGVPMVIIYKVSALSHLVAKVMLSIDRIGIVNIATGEDIVPELVQSNLKPGALALLIHAYLNDREAYARMKQGYGKLREILSDADASERAAGEVIKLLEAAV